MDEPAGLERSIPFGVAILAASLSGLGIIFWVAANWDLFSRAGRFGLLQCAVAAACVGALGLPAARRALALLALLAIGALFAYFGQTYQTGADPWQLFAMWAALSLPLCLAARHDALWAPWTLVAMSAITLWMHAHTSFWAVRASDLPWHMAAWTAALLLVVALHTGAGAWSTRLAASLAALLLVVSGLVALFGHPVAPQYYLALAIVTGAAAALCTPRLHDTFVLSAFCLAWNILLVGGMVKALLDAYKGDPILETLIIGVVAAAMLAATVKLVIVMARKHGAASPSGEAERPWPVVLLTALGAWLAALPLIYCLEMLLRDALDRGAVPYFVAALAVCQGAILLRVKTVPVFVEQLAVPLLLVGGFVLSRALFRDLPDQAAAGAIAATLLAVAYVIPQSWLRTVLGAAACVFTVTIFAPQWDSDGPDALLFGLLAVVALWLAMLRSPHAGLVAMSNGWVLAALAGLAYWSGMTFLASASIGWSGPDRAGDYGVVMQLASLLPAAAAAAWTGRCWPSLRTGWSACTAAAVIGLAWLMPSLGAVLLILAVCATRRHWRLAAAAGVAAAWIVGAFYYQLSYPLATKALIMLAAGAFLGVVAWSALRRGGAGFAAPASPALTRPLITLCALAALGVANVGIWQKETLIAEGKPVFIELGPVDPRSLMQGDYMRLAFDVPAIERDRFVGTQRPRAVGKIDARGVLTLERLDQGGAPAPGEIGIELTRAGNRWTVATDAWYFKEGGGARLANARYGEFRVAPDGRALLVGMRGPQLEKLTP
jgi:uncharacterized membrane-anchored protein